MGLENPFSQYCSGLTIKFNISLKFSFTIVVIVIINIQQIY
jgi:hypothetical protein